MIRKLKDLALKLKAKTCATGPAVSVLVVATLAIASLVLCELIRLYAQ